MADTDPSTNPETSSLRLDLLVARRFSLSRRASREAVLNGRIDLEGERCQEPGQMVAEGSRLDYVPDRPKLRRVHKAGLDVLHEDPHLLAVVKPPGLLTLPTAAGEPDTLVDRARRYLTIRHGRPDPYVGIIHRLDRETSGVLAFARSPRALAAFQDLFKRHDVERRYLAVVEGNPSRNEGTIELALAAGTDDLRRRVARPGEASRHAITHYRVLERFGPVASLLACWLETGRTHQIRIHLAALGHPVVGDPVYRPASQPRSKARFQRQALHAQTLAFEHPITRRPVRLEAPPPPDLAALINDLRNRYGLPNSGG